MTVTTLSHVDFFHAQEALHFSRVVLAKNTPKGVHDHDFFELFWLHHGTARHLINGEKQKLTEGDVVFVRPSDRHALQGTGEETHAVSIAFPPDLIANIAGLFAPGDDFFWTKAKLPAMAHRNPRQLAGLSHRAVALENGARDRLAAAAFLLTLFDELRGAGPHMPENAPDWLSNACAAALRPEVFRLGAAGLVRAGGHSHAHVSRTMKKLLHQTPSEFINKLRMDHAARRLTGSSDPLPEIAADCGIPNLSHFHRLFREYHAMTPSQYRRRYQKNVVQPI